jgi:hypothetical protein
MYERTASKGKWRLWPAALIGLGLTSLTFVTSNLADGGKDLNAWLQHGRPGEIAGYLMGQFLWLPVILVIGVTIRNTFVKNSN